FSLVHDDIMDADDTRRGRPTVHTKWDDATAILAGDVLFARAFETLAAIPDQRAHREVSVLLSTAVRRLCEGQALDVAFETRDDVGVAEYVEMIRGKTAVLFEAACRAGALCAGAPGAAEALGRFGEAFGLAFQVADDLLDVTADSATMGKPWGSDVRSGKQTVLVLEALATADDEQRVALTTALGNPDATDEEVQAAVDAMRACGAIGRAEALRDRLAKDAAAALASLPATPARRHLEELNEWARVRGF
ncbi:MAG TPA: polyprenyl synthetase family protein, partial [Candidatus Thermoplasmatota archaeon]|nr:polyprenyl synthetase family protein [Candidatus Thermoplasmatota archaeon]